MYKDKNRKDQYGNELLTKEAFMIALNGMAKAVKYYEPIAKCSGMNVVDYIREFAIDNIKDAASKALEEKYYDEYEYDLTSADTTKMLAILGLR